MPTSDDYARWIVANADKKGTPDFETVAQAYRASLPPAPASPAVHDANSARVAGDQITQDAQGGPSFLGEVAHQVGNLVAGGVRGAGSIGATLMIPADAAARAVNGGKPISVGGYDIAGQDRRAGMDAGLTEMGADTTSPAFRVGKLGGEIAGTAGAGGLIANGAARIPIIAEAAPNLLAAIRTGGMSAGNATGATNALVRVSGGAINGGVTAGMVDPNQAGAGAAVGGVLPGATKASGLAGTVISDAMQSGSRRLMQSAVKPTIAQLRTGDADVAVQTLLDNGINPTKGGVEKLRALIDDKNNAIAQAIGSSTATIPKANVVGTLGDVRARFGNQVSPTSDLGAIQGVEDDFLNHPNYPGDTLPVQAAQDLKQGTYRVLSGKFGEMGSASTEAQKGLARGLKEEIASAVPEVGPLNAEESRLLTTLSVTERRALLEANKNPGGLALLAHNPLSWAAFMADKSALFKSLAARAVNNASTAPAAVTRALGNGNALTQMGYRAAPALAGDD